MEFRKNEFIKRLEIITGGRVLLISEYKGRDRGNMCFSCLDCNSKFESTNNISRDKNFKCPMCKNNRNGRFKWTNKRLLYYLNKYNLIIYPDSQYKDCYLSNDKILLIDSIGCKYEKYLNQLEYNKPNMLQNNKYALENAKLWIKTNRPDYELISNNYSIAKEKMLFRYLGDLPKNINREFMCGLTQFIHDNTEHPYIHISKGELKIKRMLDKLMIAYIQHKTFDSLKNPKTGYHLNFDFYLPQFNLCIEFDGIDHFPDSYMERDKLSNKYSSRFTIDKYQDTKYRDTIKTKYCSDNNIKLLRIPYLKYNYIESILKMELNILV